MPIPLFQYIQSEPQIHPQFIICAYIYFILYNFFQAISTLNMYTNKYKPHVYIVQYYVDKKYTTPN